MKYFLDTEFIERPNYIHLISIGIVCEDGREYYAISREFPLGQVWDDDWLRNNVLLPIHAELTGGEGFSFRSILNHRQSFGFDIRSIREQIIRFIGKDKPEFYGYYADYDWVVFCWIFGRMIDLPKNFPMFCIDLKQMMLERGLDGEWKRKNCPDPENEHNALADAKWNHSLYKAILQEPH